MQTQNRLYYQVYVFKSTLPHSILDIEVQIQSDDEAPLKMDDSTIKYDPNFDIRQLQSRISYLHLASSLTQEEMIVKLWKDICSNRRLVRRQNLQMAAGKLVPDILEYNPGAS